MPSLMRDQKSVAEADSRARLEVEGASDTNQSGVEQSRGDVRTPSASWVWRDRAVSVGRDSWLLH